MAYIYSSDARARSSHALPDVEVFQLTAQEIAATMDDEVSEYLRRPEFRLATMNNATRERMLDAMVRDLGIQCGWFWQACFPGCLPDGPPMGPFDTRDEAIDDARANAQDEDEDEDDAI